MKWFWLLLFWLTLSFGQKKPNTSIDSTKYYIDLAVFNRKTDNYKSSLEFSQKAIDFANAKRDKKSEASAQYSLATTYFELKKYEDAIIVFQKCILLLSTLPPTDQLAICYYDMGMCLMNLDEFNKAEIYFNKSQAVYSLLKIDATEPLNLQKGILYKKRGRNDLASILFNQIAAKPDGKDIYKIKAEALYQLGVIESEQNHNNLAVNYLNRALKLNEKDNNLEQKASIVIELSKSYEKLLDIKKSHQFLKKHLQIKDSLVQNNSTKLSGDDFMDFKESERIKTIEQMTKESQIQQKTNKFVKLISILGIALISILSLLSLSLYKNNIIRSKSNELLKEKNSELQIAKDKAEKASKARAEFLSTVSHELRTPLNAINGITHLLIEDNPKKTQLHYLNSLKFSGNYLLTFINEILEINRIESSNIEIEYLDFNLKQLLIDIQNSMNEIAAKNQNRFLLDIDDNIPETLIGDTTKLSQIFINLINNALKFTENGEVKVTATLIEKETEYSRIKIQVSDTGIGIPEEKKETIFDSFSQGSIEINRKYGGTGLGLTIVKKLVDLLGGEISLESEVGVGTVFQVEFNLANSGKESKTKTVVLYSEEILIGKNVLVIEDNKINQMVTKKMLENKGMSCKIIDNGEEAIEVLKAQHNFDLVLMDVHLPGINGTIATQYIREFNHHIPIIALTAISLNENREMLMSFGMTDVVTKPFEPDNFYKAIAVCLSKSN
ncbi:ATP-binding protein [Flavobacterium sp.]|jgi:signal transduction histidine kinase/CheY-like chemotaxis protein|uniref:tetratricopeptide repeat-containing hybrid sensor histidine kinase/response regulator n=1 Tax=Flavobacterium sp. TaxID=239 RepID=UPI0037BFB29B